MLQHTIKQFFAWNSPELQMMPWRWWCSARWRWWSRCIQPVSLSSTRTGTGCGVGHRQSDLEWLDWAQKPTQTDTDHWPSQISNSLERHSTEYHIHIYNNIIITILLYIYGPVLRLSTPPSPRLVGQIFAQRRVNFCEKRAAPHSTCFSLPPLPPPWVGSPGSSPNSLLFASYWQHFWGPASYLLSLQHFWLPASHLLGTC